MKYAWCDLLKSLIIISSSKFHCEAHLSIIPIHEVYVLEQSPSFIFNTYYTL